MTSSERKPQAWQETTRQSGGNDTPARRSLVSWLMRGLSRGHRADRQSSSLEKMGVRCRSMQRTLRRGSMSTRKIASNPQPAQISATSHGPAGKLLWTSCATANASKSSFRLSVLGSVALSSAATSHSRASASPFAAEARKQRASPATSLCLEFLLQAETGSKCRGKVAPADAWQIRVEMQIGSTPACIDRSDVRSSLAGSVPGTRLSRMQVW
mmetsp:Transcript_83238/g.235787  ORF Transcript_83238/g.235787 Transcript_83238/m.235787 type:complete len:213 (+) Transcript_83238:307-945(+)